MSTIIYISTLVLNFAGVAFAGTYIWLNVFSKITDLADRNTSILKITKTSMILSMVFSLLSCLLSNTSVIDAAIQRTTSLYSIIAISWLVVLLVCGISMLCAFVSKSTYKRELTRSIRKIFNIALWGAIISLVLSWLFS